jgi:molybdopterin-guanine dinucleotide biosynthesis protein A
MTSPSRKPGRWAAVTPIPYFYSQNTNMLGVILCGGDSTRMGRDKGLIPVGTQTWAGSAIEKMATLGIPIVVSLQDRQLPHYAQIFSHEQLIPDDPALSLKGPLAGLLSVHLKVPTEDLFVLACDLPFMDATILKELYSHRRLHNKAQAYLYTSDGEREPLCGIFTAPGLDVITGLYHAQRLVRHSMKYALDQLTVDSLPLPEDKKQFFENMNYPGRWEEDLSQA